MHKGDIKGVAVGKNGSVLEIIIPGRPVPKKNNPRIIPPKGNRKMLLLPSKLWTDYVKRVEPFILPYGNIQYTDPIQCKVSIWLQDRRRPDLINILQGVGDLLEHYGIIANDRLIQSWDGSRIEGIDRTSPRTIIKITLLQDNGGDE